MSRVKFQLNLVLGLASGVLAIFLFMIAEGDQTLNLIAWFNAFSAAVNLAIYHYHP